IANVLLNESKKKKSTRPAAVGSDADMDTEEEGYTAQDFNDNESDNESITNHTADASEEDDVSEEFNASPSSNSMNADEDVAVNKDNKFLTPLHIRNHLRLLFEKEQAICSLLYGVNGPMFGSLSKKYLNKPSNPSVKADIFFL